MDRSSTYEKARLKCGECEVVHIFYGLRIIVLRYNSIVRSERISCFSNYLVFERMYLRANGAGEDLTSATYELGGMEKSS